MTAVNGTQMSETAKVRCHDLCCFRVSPVFTPSDFTDTTGEAGPNPGWLARGSARLARTQQLVAVHVLWDGAAGIITKHTYNVRIVIGHYGGYHSPPCVFSMPPTSSLITTFTGIKL